MNLIEIEEKIARAAEEIHENGKHPYRKGPARIRYIAHPGAVVAMLKEWGFITETDPVTICTGWAHDMLEEGKDAEEAGAAILAAGGELGEEIYTAVKELTWDEVEPKEMYLARVGREAAPEILAVKIADRLCNALDFVNAGNEWGCEYFRQGEAYLFGRVDEVPHAEAVKAKIAAVKAAVERMKGG